MNETPEAGAGMNIRDYLAVLWRWKWIVILIVVTASLAAYFNAARQTSVYEATATMIYERPLDVSNPLSAGTNYVDPTAQSLDVESVAALVDSPDMTQRVTAEVGQPLLDVAPYSVSGTASEATSQSGTSNLALVTVSSSDAAQTAKLANAYAAAFIAYRVDTQRNQVKRAAAIIESKLRAYSASQGSGEYVLLRERLQDLQILQGTVTGDFRIVTPATVPTAPVAPRPKRSAMLGFGVGLFAGIGLAFVLEQFNTRLGDYREIADALGLPVVGRIPTLPDHCLGNNALVVVEHPDGHGAEAFRMLRSNLEFVTAAEDEPTRSILITSSLQGEGKSATSTALAAALALGGKRVVIVDGDLRKPLVHRYFGVPNDVGLSSVIAGHASLSDAVVQAPLVPGACKDAGRGGERPAIAPAGATTVGVLPAGPVPPNPGELIASAHFGDIVRHLGKMADIVFIDSPAMLSVGDAASIAKAVDGMLIVVNIHEVRRPTLREIHYVLEPLPCRKLGVIVVRERIRRSEYYRYGYYAGPAPQAGSKG